MLLDTITIKEKLIQLPGWKFQDNVIQATFKFKDFKECFSTMHRIAFECEAQNHHPNWINVYNTLEIKLSTHDASGVTDKDFKLAKTINKIIKQY